MWALYSFMVSFYTTWNALYVQYDIQSLFKEHKIAVLLTKYFRLNIAIPYASDHSLTLTYYTN